MKTYTTKNGDTFDLIAFNELGSCNYVEKLINANREHVGTYIFDAGVELVIPDIETEKREKKLPAWRR